MHPTWKQNANWPLSYHFYSSWCASDKNVSHCHVLCCQISYSIVLFTPHLLVLTVICLLVCLFFTISRCKCHTKRIIAKQCGHGQSSDVTQRMVKNDFLDVPQLHLQMGQLSAPLFTSSQEVDAYNHCLLPTPTYHSWWEALLVSQSVSQLVSELIREWVSGCVT